MNDNLHFILFLLMNAKDAPREAALDPSAEVRVVELFLVVWTPQTLIPCWDASAEFSAKTQSNCLLNMDPVIAHGLLTIRLTSSENC